MRLLEFLEQAIITIIEEAIGPLKKSPPFTDPWEVLDAGVRFKTALAGGFAVVPHWPLPSVRLTACPRSGRPISAPESLAAQ